MKQDLTVVQKLGLGSGIVCLTFTVVVAGIAILSKPAVAPSITTAPSMQTPGGTIPLNVTSNTPLSQQTDNLQLTQNLYSNAITSQTSSPVSQSAMPALQ